MKTMLEARMVAISTARPTSFGQGTGRGGTLWAMTCSSQGAWKIATISFLGSPARGNRSGGLRCSLSRVTYSLHEPRDQAPQSAKRESIRQYRGGSARHVCRYQQNGPSISWELTRVRGVSVWR